MQYNFTRNQILLLLLIGGFCLVCGFPAVADTVEYATESGIDYPVTDAEMAVMAAQPQLSRSEHEELIRLHYENREKIDATVDNNPPGGSLIFDQEVSILETDLEDDSAYLEAGAEFPTPSGDMRIPVNRRNTRANGPRGSTLAEPTAVQRGKYVFAAGNLDHQEVSFDRGLTWFDRSGFFGAGPADAPNLCCDHWMVIDNNSRVIFHVALFLNAARNDGVARVYVRRTVSQTSANCFYDIRPFAGSSVPDYPKLGLTNTHLFLTTNNTGAGAAAQVRRWRIDDIANCAAAPVNVYNQPFSTYGQRVFVPASGTNNIDRMYWVQHDDNDTMRIFQWDDTSTTVSSTTRNIQASNFSNGNCTSGVNNVDWIQRSTSYSITGFRLRAVVASEANNGQGYLATYWNSNTVGSIAGFHIRSAVFSLSGLTLLAQPHIFNNSFCYGYPAVNSNSRGDIGFSLFRSGRPGGSTEALNGRIGIDDEFTSGIGVIQTTFGVASGTHNPDRAGDYFTVSPHMPCTKWFVATSYALSGGTGLANVNSRYVNFGRRGTLKCYNEWAGKVPIQ